MAVRSTTRRPRDPGAPGPVVPGGTGRGFGVHWLLTGSLLGGATWAAIGAVVAAMLGGWTTAGWLLALGVALVGTQMLLAASSARIRRARAADAPPAATPAHDADQDRTTQRHLSVLPRPDQVA